MPVPRAKISRKQWMRLVERLLQRENINEQEQLSDIAQIGMKKGVPREMLSETLMGREPLVEGEYSKLKDLETKRFSDLMGKPQYAEELLPTVEARKKVFEFPERYEPIPGGQDVKRVKFDVPPGASGELAEGVAYERMKFKTIPKRKWEEEALKFQEAEAKMKELPKAPETVSPLISMIAEADDVWKNVMKGKRGIGGQLWMRYLDTSPGAVKKHFSDAKDYFRSMYIKWKLDPKGFAKKHPREANHLNQVVPMAHPAEEGLKGIIPGGAGMGMGMEMEQNQPQSPLPELPSLGGLNAGY